MSQNWRTNYLLPYRECLNVHEKNMEKNVSDKKINYFYYYYKKNIFFFINGNTI
jgi:hypothetical protein